MNDVNNILEGRYRMSAQQCAIHVQDWQNRVPTHALLLEIPGHDVSIQDVNNALDSFVRRYEILRTRYEKVAGLREPLQVVCPELPAAKLMLDTAANDQELTDAACSLLNASTGPVIASATSITAGCIRWAVAVVSYNLDLNALYGLMESCLSSGHSHSHSEDAAGEDILQYPDYCAWQEELRTTEVGRDGLRFWQGYTTAIGELPRLPFERESNTEYGQPQSLLLTENATLFIQRQAKELGISEEHILLGYWIGFIGRITETETPSFDWLYDIRQEDLDGTPGCLTLRLPLALNVNVALSPSAFMNHVVAQLQDCILWSECFDSGAYLDQRVLTGKPQNRVMFSYLDARKSKYAVRGLRQDPASSQLSCLFVNTDNGILLQWQGSRAHSETTVAAWLAQFRALIDSAYTTPDQAVGSLSMLDTAVREQLLAYNPFPLPSVGSSLLHEVFERSAVEPALIAAVCGDQQLTYGHLEQQANALATYLQRSGTRPGDLVGVYLGRSVDTLVALIAILKAGGAYLPLDPAYPMERIRYMLDDARVSRVITKSEFIAVFAESGVEVVDVNLKDNNAGSGELPRVNPASLAYVIYTSGSTGKPKGVMVSHANAVASTVARLSFYPGKNPRFLLLSSFSFDSSVAGIFWTLGQGGTLHIPVDDEYRDPTLLARLIEQNAITHLLALPSFYSQILAALKNGASLACAIVAGESCHPELVTQHSSRVPDALLVNEYGPTEGTVWSNAYRIDPAVIDARIPIGRPVPSMRGYVLDRNLELCPPGVAGEWYIGGTGITRGYLNRPALTAQRFIADPFVPGERLYRTGDLARIRPDGEVEYLGRIDQQVKLRGYRIELGEIEALLMDRPEIREAVVVLQDDPDTGQHLAACILPGEEHPNSASYAEQLTHYLREYLPAFMVPARFVLVSEFPLMPNGKVDRNLLAMTAVAQQRVTYVAPVTETEKVIADIWQNILQVERVGLADNFFNLGGHSLQGTQVAAQIRQRLSVDLPIRELFDITTLENLAKLVDNRQKNVSDELALMDQLLADLEVTQ